MVSDSAMFEKQLLDERKGETLKCINFILRYGFFAILMVGFHHHCEGLPGSPIIRAAFPATFVFTILFAKKLIQWCPLENVAFMITFVHMVAQNEAIIWQSPSSFILNPV